ncbi:MAG: metal-sensing transcriptional repressor [Oscillospiraceae bacterium]|nr:metal-sensing transcriptional repressor [Oscillospiraceae bacterium]
MNMENCCCHKTKKRSEEEYKKLMNRLSRIEGQIRGIKGMLEKDAYCVDVLLQVSAANAALNAFSRELLSEHIKGCVVNDIRSGNDETAQELVDTLQKIMR